MKSRVWDSAHWRKDDHVPLGWLPPRGSRRQVLCPTTPCAACSRGAPPSALRSPAPPRPPPAWGPRSRIRSHRLRPPRWFTFVDKLARYAQWQNYVNIGKFTSQIQRYWNKFPASALERAGFHGSAYVLPIRRILAMSNLKNSHWEKRTIIIKGEHNLSQLTITASSSVLCESKFCSIVYHCWAHFYTIGDILWSLETWRPNSRDCEKNDCVLEQESEWQYTISWSGAARDGVIRRIDQGCLVWRKLPAAGLTCLVFVDNELVVCVVYQFTSVRDSG